ncbi:MAG: hypothetical protein LBK13_12585 [Spirochaetales bacterium]|jgi:hypothetical protein|nr:hypothetical protein [Spirochaetales bacterium]
MKRKQLIEKKSGKVLNLILNNKTLISETGQAGKVKTTEKTFPSLEEAEKTFTKKEWEALKKGFVVNNGNAKTGEPILHTFIGGGYTGCLSFQQTPKGIYVYKSAEDTDYLVLIDNSGDILKEIALPARLAWSIEPRMETNSMILDIDHFIFEYRIETNSFHNLADKKRDQTSFVSVSKTTTAFATLGNIYITDNQNNVLHTISYDTETINGTTPFCGKLSEDGKLLAFHNKTGEIQIIDTANGKLIKKISADFQMIEKMEFADNNNLLVVQEKYGTWGMRYFDVSGNKEIKIGGIEIPEYTKTVNSFCFNADQSKLVLVQRTNAHVFDFNAKKLLHSFGIEHTVKTCTIKFAGDKLGVKTDYGCFSIYNI